MRPWWERDPAILGAEIRKLTEAGFRVRRSLTPEGNLWLRLEHGARRIEVVYEAALSGHYPRLTAFALDPAGKMTRFEYSWSRPLTAVLELLEGRGRAVGNADPERVLVPSEWWGARGAGGALQLGRSTSDPRALAVRALDGAENAAALGAAAAALARPFSAAVAGLWVSREPVTERTSTLEQFVAAVERKLAAFHSLTLPALRRRLRAEVGAVADPREGGWQFVRRGPKGEPIVLRAQYLYPRDWLGDRAPFAERIGHAKVSLIGCGAVGWSVAMHLARSGVRQFSLYDADRLHAANLARIGAFLPAVGRLKVTALAAQLEAVAPGVRAVAHPGQVGLNFGPQALLADRPDLIVNLTAETLSTDETNLAALALEIPALFAWVSDGVTAGRILRVRPYQSPCYHCAREAELPAISDRPVPTAPETAWQGASFDCDAFAAAVARIAVLTLAGEPVSEANPDHVVLRFGGVAPVAEPVLLARDPRCAVCGTGRPSDFAVWAGRR